MADVEGLSKRPSGYEPLPTSDRALLKEEHIHNDNYAPKASKCRIFAGHVLRFCAIIGATYILTRSGQCLWNGWSRHSKTFYDHDSIESAYHISGDIEPPHHNHHHLEPNCTLWRSSPVQGEARYSFNVSTTAEVIKLVSGRGFKGSVDYVVSDSDSLNQGIGVEITLSAPAKDEEIETPSGVRLRWLALKNTLHRKHPKAYVCSIPTHENEIKGVVLSRGPPDHHHRDHHNRYYPPFHLQLHRLSDDFTPYVTAKVLVTIPRGHLELGSFSSVFVGLTQNINRAFDEVVFKRLFIGGVTSGLPNIEAGHVSINADTSPINGSFIVKDYLELITTKAPIDVDVTLLSNATARYPTRLSLLNFNGSIDADVKLVVYSSTADAKSNGSFAINALTTRAPVDLNITSLPSNAFLGLRAANRLAPVTARVPPSYEGGFVLVTTKGDTVVKVNKATPDPEDKGRERELNVKDLGGKITAGSVKWVKSKKGGVAVEAKASKNDDDDDALDERKKHGCHGPSEEGRNDSWEDTQDMILDRSKIDLVSTNTDVVLDLN